MFTIFSHLLSRLSRIILLWNNIQVHSLQLLELFKIMRSWCRSADNPAWHSACILYVQKCGNKWSVASLQTWLRMLLLQLWVGRLSRLKEEWSYSWRFWIFRSSGVLNKQILSNSLLECLPAWPHLLNWRWISKPVCLFTTWLGKELSSAKITLSQNKNWPKEKT